MVSFSLQPVAGPNVQRDVTQAFVQTHRNTISPTTHRHLGFSIHNQVDPCDRVPCNERRTYNEIKMKTKRERERKRKKNERRGKKERNEEKKNRIPALKSKIIGQLKFI